MTTFFTPSGKKVERAAIYCRVSSPGQEDNTSLENQEEKSQAFASEHGIDIVTTRAETITGMSRWGARHGYNALLDLGKRGLIDAIACDVSDRLGRGRALSTLIDRAEREDLAVLIVEKGGPLTYLDIAVDTIKSGGERENISRRTREGKLKTIRDGKVVFAVAPYGYEVRRKFDPETGKKIDSWVEKANPRAQNVVQMFNWLLEGHTIHAIRNKLYDNHILPPMLKKRYGTWDNVPEDKPRTWSRSSIKAVLSNRTYCGKWFYNKAVTRRVETGDEIRVERVGVRDESKWEYLEIPQIIDEHTFEQAQAMLRRNKKKNSGRPSQKYFYLLRGMLHCSCGYKMIGDGANNCYRCNRQTSRIEESHSRLNQKVVEHLVWHYVRYALVDPDKMLTEWKRKREEKKKENAILLEQAETLQERIGMMQVKLDRLLDLYLNKELDKEIYLKKQKKIEDTTKDDKLELARVQAQLHQQRLTKEDERNFTDFCVKMVKRFLNHKPTFEEKRRTLLMLDVRVEWLPEKEALKIEGCFPVHEFQLITPQEADSRERDFEAFREEMKEDFRKLDSTR